MSASPGMSMETHPDIVALRNSYDELSEGPALQLAEGLMVLTGLYAATSSWIVGFDGQTPLTVSNLMCGLAVALLATAYATAYGRTHGITFVAPLLGVWLIVSPWLVSSVSTTAGMIWSNVVAGAVIVVCGAVGFGMAMTRR